jgi:hypothetical protein
MTSDIQKKRRDAFLSGSKHELQYTVSSTRGFDLFRRLQRTR